MPTHRSLYDNARREALIIMLLWLVSSVYSAGYCYLFGYKSHEVVENAYGPTVSQAVGEMESWNRPGESLTFPLSLGIPDWVFYGVVIPWLICIGLTLIFCLCIYSEDDLSEVTTKKGAK